MPIHVSQRDLNPFRAAPCADPYRIRRAPLALGVASECAVKPLPYPMGDE